GRLMRNMIVMGSTGSVGRRTLDVAADAPDAVAVIGLAAHRDGAGLLEQAGRFRPAAVALGDTTAARRWAPSFRDLGIPCLAGPEGLVELARWPGANLVVAAVTGIAGLASTLAAVEAGRDVAVANKETLVAAGALVMSAAQQTGARLLPVDSEHNAIFQCLQGLPPQAVDCIILTASGGPFRGWTVDQLRAVGPEEAVKHPNWAMGAKISVDSATLMNKGLEVIEAMHLFSLPPERIQVIVHPQSIVHGLVETHDGALLAQMAVPDMYHPIHYCVHFPERLPAPLPRLDLIEAGALTFEPPDMQTFPALRYAYEVARIGGTMPAALNAANEAAVEAFLAKRIGFLDIARVVERVLADHESCPVESLDQVFEVDRWARERSGPQLR
ncbi:MAG: 1-deoxy-D-xylulose-5-phosphate reductoisomerase, partial [Thermaerobacterales bacterium]